MKPRNFVLKAFVLAVFMISLVASAEPITVAPQYEERYHSLLNELRCLVCQNQTIAESNAELAVDLRTEVKNMLEQGATDADIIDFMFNRYGDFVLYRPVVQPKTYLLWFGPFVALALVLLILLFFIKKQKQESSAVLSQKESDQLSSILDKTNKK